MVTAGLIAFWISRMHPLFDTRISVRPGFRLRNAQGPPPWIVKRGGLESSGRGLISSIGKTKRIEFFGKKKKKLLKDFLFKKNDFLRTAK